MKRNKMQMDNFFIRPAGLDDRRGITDLYRAVAAVEGGLARTADEITDDYIENFLQKSLGNGLSLIAVLPETGRVVGEIHAYGLGLKVFSHVLGELTIAVAPDSQGAGVGRALFTKLLERVKEERPQILRVELIARESNEKAIAFYEKLGFRIEGRFEKRIRSSGGGYEADIPMAWLRGE